MQNIYSRYLYAQGSNHWMFLDNLLLCEA